MEERDLSSSFSLTFNTDKITTDDLLTVVEHERGAFKSFFFYYYSDTTLHGRGYTCSQLVVLFYEGFQTYKVKTTTRLYRYNNNEPEGMKEQKVILIR